jgi:hypothetical protein
MQELTQCSLGGARSNLSEDMTDFPLEPLVLEKVEEEFVLCHLGVNPFTQNDQVCGFEEIQDVLDRLMVSLLKKAYVWGDPGVDVTLR